MSQPELVARLRAARPVAPPELRERVRMLAAEAAVPPRRLITWRRAAVVLVPVAAAIAAAVVLLPRGGTESSATAPPVERAVSEAPAANAAGAGAALGAATKAGVTAQAPVAARALPAPSAARPQRYSAAIELRVRDSAAVSAASKRATAIVAALGGYPSSLDVSAGGTSGYASLVFRVPRARVQAAVGRLSALGTIVGENVRIQDLGGQVSAADRKIGRLVKRLVAVKAVEPQTTETERQIAILTAQIAKLRRGKAATLRTASYATVSVQLTTPPKRAPAPSSSSHGPLHGLGVAFHWIWIGAVYALALGAPLLLAAGIAWLIARTVRRRREDRLLATH
jgi:hypothetical protein